MTDDIRASLLSVVESLRPMDTPLLKDPFGPPLYAQRTIVKRIEPWATDYDDLSKTHPDYWACPDCGGRVDDEWYQPTPQLLLLDAQLDELREAGFRDVPNPDYDEERAAAWYKKRGPFNQTTVTWGSCALP